MPCDSEARRRGRGRDKLRLNVISGWALGRYVRVSAEPRRSVGPNLPVINPDWHVLIIHITFTRVTRQRGK